MRFLHDGWPSRRRRGRWEAPASSGTLPEAPKDAAGWRDVALKVLAHPTVASKEPIVRQYDHTVQGTNALAPYGGPFGRGPSDAVVLAPLLGKPYGAVIAHGLNPVLNLIDPYWGSVWAAAEALANYAAVGGDPREASLIDNFIWPAPDEASLGALDRAVDACIDVMRALGRPFISGKDSLSSTYRFPDGQLLPIPPVLCVSVFGRIPDVTATVSSDLKRPGSALVLVGARDAGAMGGSIYVEVTGGAGGQVPRIDLGALPGVLDALVAAIRRGAVAACHDVSEGGLLVALAEMGIGGGLGLDVDVGALADRADTALFNETAGVFVVELADETVTGDVFAAVPHVVLGRTCAAPRLRLLMAGEELAELDLADLARAWESPLREVFH